MGMCKGCSTVYSALYMKDGYCKTCKPGLFTEEELNSTEEIWQVEKEIPKEEWDVDGEYKKDYKQQMDAKKEDNSPFFGGNFMKGLAITSLLVGAFYIYQSITKPSDDDVIKLALKYNVGSYYKNNRNVKIIKNYEKDGKIVYILKIDSALCEMPTIKIDGYWNATGIACQ